MIKKFSIIVITGWLATMGAAQAAGDVAAGKAKAAMCVTCHGEMGEGVAPNPKLAGKPDASRLAERLDHLRPQ